MKKQYRIYFLNAESIILTDEEYQIFMNELRSTSVPFILTGVGREILIRLDTMTYVLSENIEGESNVVTPPSPTQLREERKQEEASRPVTLDDQLANPDVAK